VLEAVHRDLAEHGRDRALDALRQQRQAFTSTAALLCRFAWVSITPFGSPVVPEV